MLAHHPPRVVEQGRHRLEQLLFALAQACTSAYSEVAMER
jgi:hypothetical protein